MRSLHNRVPCNAEGVVPPIVCKEQDDVERFLSLFGLESKDRKEKGAKNEDALHEVIFTKSIPFLLQASSLK